MASAASPSRKRRSSSTDLDSGSSSKKKSRDAEKDRSKVSSQSKRAKPKSKKDIKAGLKTVSELAKLVTSGAVQVPRSLINYASDKALLLDQIFTILSPNDVNGMLPDILKGLKIKRIKSLCYEQLKGMSVEEITRALQREESTATEDVPTAEVTLLASSQTQLATTFNKTIEKTNEERVSQTMQVSSGEDHKDDNNIPNTNPSAEVERIPRGSLESKDEIILRVSDISDEDERNRDSKRAKKLRESARGKRRISSDTSNKESAILKEEYIVTSLRVATHKKKHSDDRECAEHERHKESPNLEIEKQTDDTKSKDDVMRSDDVIIIEDNVMSEANTCEDLAVFDGAACSELESSNEDSDLDVEVSELDPAKLLEMEMRRRALESELKKFTQNNNQTTSQTSLDDSGSDSQDECDYLELYVSASEMLDSEGQSTRDHCNTKHKDINQHENRDAGPSVDKVKVDGDTMDVGQLLEMKLRQKALQSLLSKRKQNSMH